MKLLITGAGGQLGRTLAETAAAQHTVIALDRRGLDITDHAAVAEQLALHQPDCVINTAAYTAVDKAESEPALARQINADGPANLARACAELDIPLIHISTDYVFSGDKASPYTETDAVNPINVYGETKALGEAAVRDNWDEHIILRVSWVFGYYGSNFVKTIRRLAHEREALRVVADQQGCPTSTANIARVLLQICDKLGREGFADYGTYHYCDSPDSNWYAFADAIIEASRQYEPLALKRLVPITTEEYPTPARRQANSRLDCSKIQTVFAIERYSWQTALDKLIEDLNKP